MAAPILMGPPTLARIVARRITDYRRERQITQIQLAAMARLSRNTLNRAEAGEITPKVKTLGRIALALEIEIAALLPNREQQSQIEEAAGTGKDVLCELAKQVGSIQENDRFLLLQAVKGMARGQTFMLDTITV